MDEDVAMGGMDDVYGFRDHKSLLKHLELEGETRMEEIVAEGDRLARTLKRKFRIALNNLPDYIRRMSLEELVHQYKGSLENAQRKESDRMKADFNDWVKDVHTPMRSSRARKKSTIQGKKNRASIRSETREARPQTQTKRSTSASEAETPRQTRSSSRLLKRLETDLNCDIDSPLKSSRRVTRSSARLSKSRGRSQSSSKEDLVNQDQNVQILMKDGVKERLRQMEPTQRQKVEQLFSGMEQQLNSLLDELK